MNLPGKAHAQLLSDGQNEIAASVLDHLAPRLRWLMRNGVESDEASARRAADFVGLFGPLVLESTMDVLADLRAREETGA